MNIAWVVPGGVDRSGTHRVIPALLWQLERLAPRHHLTVFALAQEPSPGEWPLLGARIVNIGARPRRLRALARLLVEHRRRRFDIVHAFWAVGPGGPAASFARFTGVPLVVSLQGGELIALRDINYGGLMRARGRREARRVLRRAAAVTALSAALAEQAAPFRGGGVPLVPLGVDRRQWPAEPPRRRDAGAPLRLVQVASLNRVKDQPLLLAVCGILRARAVPFTLDVVGEDTLGGAMQRLAETAAPGLVRWHGFLPQSAVRPLVAAADVHVVTSRHEGGPVAVAEAAMCGVPTVGTAVGYLRDLAPSGAAVVAPADAAGFADTVQRVGNDEEARLRVAAAAQAWALARDADWTASRFDDMYRIVMERAR